MHHIDTLTRSEILSLAAVRATAAVSIFVDTTNVTQQNGGAKIEYKNLVKDADAQMQAVGIAKRTRWAVIEKLDELAEDDDFWARQAETLAVFATEDRIETLRLPTKLDGAVEVSDRFHVKPLMRSLAYPDRFLILALEEGDVRLIESIGGATVAEIRVPDMPKDAASAVGKSTINDPSHDRGVGGQEGKKVRLRQYARAVDAALRPVLRGEDAPLVLIAPEALVSIFRDVSSQKIAAIVPQTPANTNPQELSALARPEIDAVFAAQIEAFHDLYAKREPQGRATADLSAAARAATFGAVDTLLIDIDETVPGFVDPDTGAISLDAEAEAANYGVLNEIAVRAMRAGAEVIGVRKEDMNGQSVMAVLRYAL